MKHLNDDERLAIIEGRATREAAEHLKACGECAAEVDAWRRSVAKLQSFDWPARREIPRRSPFPLVRFAAAAALALCAGFAAGKLSAPNTAAIKAQVSSELRQEMKRDVQAEFARLEIKPKENPRDSQRSVLALLEEIREQQAANYLSLRGDLETLASTADARMQLTRRQLLELQLASMTQSKKNTTQQ